MQKMLQVLLLLTDSDMCSGQPMERRLPSGWIDIDHWDSYDLEELRNIQ